MISSIKIRAEPELHEEAKSNLLILYTYIQTI